MSVHALCKVLGKYLFSFAALLLIPLGVSIFYEVLDQTLHQASSGTFAFFKTILVCLFLALVLSFFGRRAKEDTLHRREGILLVVLIWFLTAAVSALPFMLAQKITHPVDAYFEAMSGLTTTGATIIHPKAYALSSGKEVPITLQNPLEPAISYTFFGTIAPIREAATGAVLREGIEALGKPLLFWRCFLQWLGGVGVVVLFVAILPALSMRGRLLYENEATGPTKEGLTPRIQDTAVVLLKIYMGLTFGAMLMLFISDTGLPFFDLITLAFSTISTGGFTTHNACLEEYLNGPSLFVVALFMILGGLNFSLYFYCLKRRFSRLYQPELLYYLLLLFAGGALVCFALWKNSGHFQGLPSESYSAEKVAAYGFFQAISSQTSTGFSIANYDAWPYASQFVLILLMYIGGMSGSTAGGIKVIRFVMVWRVIRYKIEAFFHQDIYRVIRVGSQEISEKAAGIVLSFFCIVIFLVVLGTFFLTLDGNDPLTALAIISTTINNTGLFFGGIGCTSSLAYLSDFSKMIAIIWMVLGRLEFLTLLALLFPSFWKNR